jgi:hypothetical protein
MCQLIRHEAGMEATCSHFAPSREGFKPSRNVQENEVLLRQKTKPLLLPPQTISERTVVWLGLYSNTNPSNRVSPLSIAVRGTSLRLWRGVGGEVQLAQKIHCHCHLARHFKLKITANYRHAAIKLAYQLATLPHKNERRCQFCHLHLALPPTGKKR